LIVTPSGISGIVIVTFVVISFGYYRKTIVHHVSTIIIINIREDFTFHEFIYLFCFLAKIITIDTITFLLFWLLLFLCNNCSVSFGIDTIIIIIGSLLIGTTGNQ
jgi:hypothetical protein